jgi:transmembrane sensor
LTSDLQGQSRFDEAGNWYLRLRQEPALEISPEFLDWISNPDNARALRAAEMGMGALSELNASPLILDLRRSALKSMQQAGKRRWPSRPIYMRWAVAAALLISAIGVAGYSYLRSGTAYETGVGEHRQVMLADGSKISLDSGTEVHVNYSERTRAIVLNRGQARFDVAHDVKRPFTVTAGTETVIAVGTSFNVEKLQSSVLVTLIQGRIVIKSAAAPASARTESVQKPVSLVAGQQMVATADNTARVAAADIQEATAWETGQLVFRGVSLADAVERENRYTDHPIAVDPSVANIKVSGVFNAGDTGSFVSAMTSLFPVQATTDSESGITLQRRS